MPYACEQIPSFPLKWQTRALRGGMAMSGDGTFLFDSCKMPFACIALHSQSNLNDYRHFRLNGKHR